MSRRTTWGLAWLLVLPLAQAAPPADTQSRLDRAVIDHAEGRRGSARIAFERLAREGVPAAAYNLGVMALERPGGGNAQAARRWFERAAAGGFVTAMLALGQLHEGGRLGAVDLVASQRWNLLAAEAGSADGALAAGTAYYLGRGAPKSPAEAARWFREAAKGGDVGAQYLLASMYEQGDGVGRDLRLARYWYDAAAKNGDVAAPGKVRELDQRLKAE